jgi:molybdopterin-binding protein
MAQPMTRTQVCQTLGVSPKSLYLWERDGKIPIPARDHRGWRVYTPEQVDAIRAYMGGWKSTLDTNPILASDTQAVAGLSARNQLRGRVISIHGDGVLCEVVLQLGDGQEIVSVVTRRSMDRMGLKIGEDAVAVIKSTEVMLFK